MSGSKNILWIGAALLVAGCTVKDFLPDTLSGEGKTPLLIEASIHDGHEMTKAINGSFSDGDEFWGYLRHTTGGSKGSYTVLNHANATNPTKQIRVKRYSGVWTSVELNYSTSSSPLYWDDFSNSAVSETDMRTAGHGLQSYYAYCYNGGTPSTALDVAAGTLGWTVATNQNTDSYCRKSDLLWSPEQETVAYVHGSSTNDAHHTLSIPFTHAMSEITVTVHANEGYANNSSQWSSTALTLHGMNTVASLTAPTGTVSGGTTADITMLAYSLYDNYRKCDFTAIVAPESKLKVGDKLLDITFLDGNNYEVYITSDMVPKDDDDDDSNNQAWSNNHAVNTESDKDYILTKPGYNYHLNLTVNKAKVLVNATITDWTSVDAEGEGDIIFSHDDDPEYLVMDDSENPGTPGSVQVVAVDENEFQDNSAFTLFWCEAASAEAAADPNKVNSNYRFASIISFHNVDNSGNPKAYDYWTNNPTIFWPNNSKNYYFRALAKYKGVVSEHEVLQSVGKYNSAYLTDNDTSVSADFNEVTGVSQGSINDGHDILWGTTALHYGTTYPQKTYQRSQAIPPRTGGVPIAFEHAMSKITFNALHTGSGSAESANDPAVDLTGATIALANLYTAGTISIETGTITLGSLTAKALEASTTPPSNLVVIPQTFTDDAQVVVTLNNGTIYRLPLKQCVVSGGSTPITAWERGKNYTYSINVKKEGVQFHVQVKDWEEVTGSGDAIIDWSNE